MANIIADAYVAALNRKRRTLSSVITAQRLHERRVEKEPQPSENERVSMPSFVLKGFYDEPKTTHSTGYS